MEPILINDSNNINNNNFKIKNNDLNKETIDKFIEIDINSSYNINNKKNNNPEFVNNELNNKIENNKKINSIKFLLLLNITIPFLVYYIYIIFLDEITENTKEIKIVTHVFRSMWSLSLFFCLTSLNVYIWEIFNIDYKSIFKLKEYSNFIQIDNNININNNNNGMNNINNNSIFLYLFKRSIVLFLILTITLIININYNNNNNNNNLNPNSNYKEYNIPLLILIWSIFFSCIFYDHFLRSVLINSLIMILKSPFKSITFLSFWIADQITSLSIFLKDFNITLCFLISLLNVDLCFNHFKWISPILLSLPFIFRISQCFRVYLDTKNVSQLFNAYKYFIGLVVLFFSNLYHYFYQIIEFKYYWILFATTGTIYSFFWDVVKDWGLFKNLNYDQNINYLLRDKLIYNYKPFYYYSIISNLIMRFNWLILIDPFSFGFKSNNEFIIGTFLISIDIIRRCQWNYIRMEYEYITNFKNDEEKEKE